MAWDMSGNGERVLRASFGRYFTLGIKNWYYLAAIQDKPTLFLTPERANSAFGVGPLAGYVYGVSPLPPVPKNITQLPAGGNDVGTWYDPEPRGFPDRSVRGRLFARAGREQVLELDYSRYRGKKGWRTLNINPLLARSDNPAGARIRPLAADLQRVYGDPALMGPVTNIESVNEAPTTR